MEKFCGKEVMTCKRDEIYCFTSLFIKFPLIEAAMSKSHLLFDLISDWLNS